MRSTVVMFVLTFAVFGLLLGYATSYSSNEQALQLTTDKPEYTSGDVVTFTAKNVGSKLLVFPDSALGMTIRNLDTGESYGVIAARVLTPVEAGQSRQLVWQDAGEAAAGNYTAAISTAGGSSPAAAADVKFEIN